LHGQQIAHTEERRLRLMRQGEQDAHRRKGKEGERERERIAE
jgi:hypothetical protein